MQLGDLLDDVTLDAATASIEVRDVQIDSRECANGSLFFAMPGGRTSGVTHALDAVERGAVAIVSAEPLSATVPVIVISPSQLRARLGDVSSSIVGHPERRADLVGVTGTNGKTTTTSLVAQLASELGWNAGNVGTLTNVRTTPAAPELYRTLSSIVDGFSASRHRSVVALEVSSHALDQGRVEGIRFAVAAFTNLSHDHLDYHGTMEQYFAAKAQLFTPEHSQRAVIWGDDPYGERLAAQCTIPVSLVRRSDASALMSSILGSTFLWRDELVTTPLVGGYNVDNALVAMTILSVLGAADADVALAMSRVRRIPGRFEVVASDDVVVVVDYAHTPEGLRRLLLDVRGLLTNERIITVFGCGGDRDREKRPRMGQVATELSDVTIVTSDNPRSESPDAIIDEIMSGVITGSDVRRERDRRTAIAAALDEARSGDVVVLAGKGHETVQVVGNEVIAFDDRVVARELLR